MEEHDEIDQKIRKTIPRQVLPEQDQKRFKSEPRISYKKPPKH